mmetsp:Transcript_11578/g.25740  ORF Transcript_11578/g.25740 Transcript_11578/m.25740 type:complete len:167 (-) Transcript_11578:156-656(-)
MFRHASRCRRTAFACATSALITAPPMVFCEEKINLPFSLPAGFPPLDIQLPKSMEELQPFVGTGGASTATGFTMGYALKKLGRGLAVFSGIVFMGLQVAGQSGYVTVNWKKIEADMTKAFDQNNDGKLDQQDLNAGLQGAIKYLSGGTALATTGFSTGFLAGFWKG